MSGTLHVVLPTLKPVGGIVKCYDYIGHALNFGLDVRVYCGENPEQSPHLFANPNLMPVLSRGVAYHPYREIYAAPDDLYFFSLPSDFLFIEPLLRQGVSSRSIIHIIQNTRHAQATFQDGYALRLLTRPMSRITINRQVHEAIRPYLHDTSYVDNIPLAHDSSFFYKPAAASLSSPVRVGYTTWKSGFGDRIAWEMRDDARFAFRALNGTVSWPELREFYHSIDVLLCTPNRKEGFYLPGLEAMAAGCIVLIPDVEGNMSYCDFGRNCFGYEFENCENARDRLEAISKLDATALEKLHAEAEATWRERGLESERTAFRAFLEDVGVRLPA